MKRKSGRRPSAPPNLAAKSLAEARNRARVVRSRKHYTRKIKHKKGSQFEAPLFRAA